MKPPTLNRMYLFEALPVILPQTRANYPRGAGLFAVSNFPRLRMGQESRRETFPPPGRDKNRAAKPSRRLGETRIVPRNLAAIRERQESRRETFPPPGRDKKRAAKPSRRVVWVRKQCF